MADFRELMKIPGVTLAGEFTDGGVIIAYEGDFPREIAGAFARICAAHWAAHRLGEELLQTLPESAKLTSTCALLLAESLVLYIGRSVFLLVKREHADIQALSRLEVDFSGKII